MKGVSSVNPIVTLPAIVPRGGSRNAIANS